MRRRRRKRVSMEPFWAEVTDDGTRPCRLAELGGCDGPLDAHHHVPKRRLRTDEAKLDYRNGVPLCRRHHELVENGVLRSPRPPWLNDFLAAHRLTEMGNQRP